MPRSPRWLNVLIGDDFFESVVNVVLHDNNLADISPLTNLPELVHLHIQGKSVTDLSPLAELSHLKLLDLHCPEARDLSPLEKLEKLKTIYLPPTVPKEDVAKLKAVPGRWVFVGVPSFQLQPNEP